MEIDVFLEDASVARRRKQGGLVFLHVPAIRVTVYYDSQGEWDVYSLAIMGDGPARYHGDTQVPNWEFWADIEPADFDPTVSELMAWDEYREAIEEAVAEALQADGYQPERPEGPTQRERL